MRMSRYVDAETGDILETLDRRDVIVIQLKITSLPTISVVIQTY